MQPRGSIPHSQGPPIIPILSRINPILGIDIYLKSILIFSHLRLGLTKGFFPVGLPVKILKALLPSSILATLPAKIILLVLIITLSILGVRYKL